MFMAYLLRYGRCATRSWLFLRSRIARLGFGIHGIETSQYGARVHLLDDPAFHSFLLSAFGQDKIQTRLRDHYGAVLVGDDNVVREDRDAAAADRVAPTDEGQPGYGRGSGKTVAPHRQAGAEHALEIAHHAVGH